MYRLSIRRGPVVVALGLAACNPAPKRPSAAGVMTILTKGTPFATSSFYTCLLNGVQQGLPLKQVQDECETKLGYANARGFAQGDLTGPFTQASTSFDPGSVRAACAAGDPRLGEGRVAHVGKILLRYHGAMDIKWDEYTWGGADQCDDKGCYKGLSQEDSEAQKRKSIREANAAYDEWSDADDAAKASPKDRALRAKADSLQKVAIDKIHNAQSDPNKVLNVASTSTGTPPTPAPGSRASGPSGSKCDEALEAARAVLGECQRTGWRSPSCQKLWARMNRCVNPELIYVDPESGYSCGAKFDREAVKQAWVERCRELKRPVPGGPDPCEPPDVDALGHYINAGSSGPICNDPAVRRDPDSPECLEKLVIQSQTPDAQSLLVWGLNKLGGPIVVLPDPHPDPEPLPPGPPPTPGPS